MGEILTSSVQATDIDRKIYKLFDLFHDHEGDTYTTTFEVPNLHDQIMTYDNGNPLEFNIGLIVGSSGSGKSSILKQFGEEYKPTWIHNASIASHFGHESFNVDEAIERLSAVGLNSVPTWAKPRHVLSNGEGFRADLARRLTHGAVIDEFTSVVNRNVAKSCSASVAKYIRRNDLSGIVFASCHDDIIDWLEPDWVYNTDTKQLVSRGSQRRWVRPSIKLSIYKCHRSKWEMFKKHHYLNHKIPSAVRCWIAKWGDEIVGFSSSICLPGRIPGLYEGDTRGKWRECRTVCLPDFQGVGIGTKLSDAIADIHIEGGLRYFSKTSHIRMGEYRQKSPLWRATATNLKDRSKSGQGRGWHHYTLEKKRICYSHEYIGADRKSYDPKWLEVYNASKND